MSEGTAWSRLTKLSTFSCVFLHTRIASQYILWVTIFTASVPPPPQAQTMRFFSPQGKLFCPQVLDGVHWSHCSWKSQGGTNICLSLSCTSPFLTTAEREVQPALMLLYLCPCHYPTLSSDTDLTSAAIRFKNAVPITELISLWWPVHSGIWKVSANRRTLYLARH